MKENDFTEFQQSKELESEEDLIKIGDLDFKIKSGLIDKVSGMELFLFGI